MEDGTEPPGVMIARSFRMFDAPPETILDYASPMAKTPLRLASRSVISIIPTDDGVEITETLTGQSQALAAIIFSASMVVLMGCTAMARIHPRHWSDLLDAIPVLIFYVIYAGGTAALIVAVIHSSWRRTILTVSPEQTVLLFRSPLKEKSYAWLNKEIRHVLVTQELIQSTWQIVYKLQLEIADRQTAQLFGGHDADELAEIAKLIRKFLPQKASYNASAD
jgi:hypothetical protein